MKILYTLCLILLFVSANAQTNTSDWQDVQITACLENDQVSKYLEEIKYPPTYIRYTYDAYSKIKKYCDVETDYRKDQPAPVTIPLPFGLVEDMILVYNDSANATRKDTIIVPKGSTEIQIWNLTPSHTYYYNVGELTKGTIHTTGQVRQLRIDSGFNIRDIGGWPTANGKRLRYGRIYRGCELSDGKYANLTPKDSIAMRDIGIRAEIDLRAENGHVSGAPLTQSALGEDCTYLGILMKDEITILNNFKDEYRLCFEFIHKNLLEGRPVYIHCTFGADRTGLMCAILETICDVPINHIFKDYELTSMAYLDAFERNIYRYYSGLNQRLSRALGITSPDIYYTTVYDYLTDRCGISSTIIEEIIEMLVEGENDPFNSSNITEPNTSHTFNNSTMYTIDGRKCTSFQKGITIIRDKEGRIRKVTNGF